MKALPLTLGIVAMTLGLSMGSSWTLQAERFNVLFIISDDLSPTALSCYGNTICQTPHIDRLAARGTRFTQAFCQGTYCGPSRASFMSGYYPHATGVLGYKNPRPQIGNRPMWSQYFKDHGYYSARVSKIFHMGVPGGLKKEGTEPMTPLHGRSDSIVRVRSGRRRAPERPWREIRMEGSRWLAGIPSWWLRPMVMTSCIPMERPPPKPAT